MHIPSETEADLIDALFADGLTTRDEATEASGRGVGMSAVKNRVESMGGQVSLQSERGRGTTVVFRFPRRDSVRAPALVAVS